MLAGTWHIGRKIANADFEVVQAFADPVLPVPDYDFVNCSYRGQVDPGKRVRCDKGAVMMSLRCTQPVDV
eukprot:350499-Chlamydomonas_euryale.AAC.10